MLSFLRFGSCVLGNFAYTVFFLLSVFEVFIINCFFTHFALSFIIFSFIGICNQQILPFFYSFMTFVNYSELEVRFLTQTTYLWYVKTSHIKYSFKKIKYLFKKEKICLITCKLHNNCIAM